MRAVIGRLGVVAVALVAASAVGCGTDCPKCDNTPAVSVAVVKYAGLEKAVEKENGKVVLVDFWATFCGPCVKKFPHFVALHEKYAEKGLVCVSVSRDDAADLNKVRAFLVEKKATFPNFLLELSSAEDAQMAKKFNYDYTIPQMALFGKTGTRVWDSNTDPLDKDMTAFIGKLDVLVKAELDKP